MFLGVMPAKVWQFVDRPEDRVFLRGLIGKALGTEGLAEDQKRALDALSVDLDQIDRYGEERLAREAVPPITDKKYR